MNTLSRLDSLGHVVKTDILIIGGGPSGLWAAIKAKRWVDAVTVVDKGPTIGSTCPAYFSGGSFVAVTSEEEVDDFVEDMVYFEDGLVEQDILESVARQSLERIRDLEKFGSYFVRGSDGRLKGIPQRGLKHVTMYKQGPYGMGGKLMVEALVNEARRLGVRFLSRVFITDILKRNGEANGAVGFDTRSGEFYVIKAKAVVLCTGSGNIRSHYPNMRMSSGDGVRMALETGCELRNLEFVSLWVVPKHFSYSGITSLLPMGARFVNSKGETFIEKYSPILKSNCDFNYLSMFMAIEAREGKGPFYLDCAPLKPEDRSMMQPQGGWRKLQQGKLMDIGTNMFDERTEWMPGFHGTMGGSVKTNEKMETAVPALYVAGRLRSTDIGLYAGGWALSTCAAFGCWAGENAGRYAASCESTLIDEDEVIVLKQNIYAPLGKVGINPEEVIKKIQRVIFPYDVILLKNEKNLARALSKIKSIREELLPQIGARDPHYLRTLFEARSMTVLAELILMASRMRTESRGSHYREDYAARDDKNWLKWINIRLEDEKLKLTTEPVPLEKYKFKPIRYYSDNFRFPKQYERKVI